MPNGKSNLLQSTSKFKVERIIYRDDEREFAIATGYWDGDDKILRIACRWFNDDIGYPQTFGKPQWMLLPDGIKVDLVNLLDPTIAEVVIHFRNLSSQTDRPLTEK